MVNKSGGKKGKGTKGSDKRGFYLLLIAIAVVGIGTLSYMAVRPSSASSWVDSTVTAVPNRGHVIGSDSALVEVVEFADFECPACGSFATLTEPDVMQRLVRPGIIRYRFVDLPLDMHRNTRPAHHAAWCASDQNKFWEMHDVIFQNQDRWSGTATRRPEGVLEDLAKRIGLDMAQYSACMDSRKYAGQIQANYDEAVRLGVASTPTFIIGNRRVASALPYDEFKRYVDEALAQAQAQRARTGAAK